MKEISLIGNSGIQFYDCKADFSENSDILKLKEEYCIMKEGEELKLVFPYYYERKNKYVDKYSINSDAFRKDGTIDENKIRGNLEFLTEDKIRTVTAREVLECFEGTWIPVPFFRKGNYDEEFQPGPTTWSRMWFNAISKKNIDTFDNSTHNIVLSFDTKCTEEKTNVYVKPTSDDLKGAAFECAYKIEDISEFLNEEWLNDWLIKTFENNMKNYRPVNEGEEKIIYLAFYVTFLKMFVKSDIFPRVFLYGKENAQIEVDLVLDIGNSRTCGLLVETSQVGKPFSFTEVSTLEIRDLSIPDRIYNDSFEMRCEFVEASFGEKESAKLAGVKDNFTWPSLVRIGPEAVRHSVIYGSTKNDTGMSSPKRYLWDTEKRVMPWYFSKEDPVPVNNSQICGNFTEEGILIDTDGSKDGQRLMPGMTPYYSRSSLMTFALAEIIFHAIIQTNSYSFRKKKGNEIIPRKLKRVLLTCPTAMLETEKHKLRTYAQNAVMLLNLLYNKKKENLDKFGKFMFEKDNSFIIDSKLEVIPNPNDDFETAEKREDWNFDEATCTQLAYLYGEITKRYKNNFDLYFKSEGKIRKDTTYSDYPSLTIASIDIGGGTTDLMLCNYQPEPNAHNTRLKPDPKFWEGFNLAGDDILLSISERIVLPAIRKAAEEKGCKNSADVINFLFGPDLGSLNADDRVIRKQFATQIALPLSIGALAHASEEKDVEVKDFNSFFMNYPMPHQKIIQHINQVFNRNGAADFKLTEVKWIMNKDEINMVIRQVLGDMIKKLCGIIHQYDCDYILLAGRPTKLPVIREMVLESLPIAPNRVISMGGYRIGSWYPFAETNGLIKDPKTCVAVGATVGLMAGTLNRLPEFTLDTSGLKNKVKSTSNYIGLFDSNSMKLKEVFFKAFEEEVTIEYYGPMFLGMRQMNSNEWPAAPMYHISYSSNNAAKQLKDRVPLKVTLMRPRPQRNPEYIKIHNITDKEGNRIPYDALKINLQTLVDEKGHWLDTGSFHLSKF